MKTVSITKKFFLLLIFVSITAFVGCSKGITKPTVPKENKETTKKEEEKSPYSDLKIGVVNIGSSKDDAGYTYTHTNGIKYMMSFLKLKNEQIVYQNNVPDNNPNSIRRAIQKCVDDGCKIIFTTSYGFKDVTLEMANKYPDIYFSHCSGNLSNGKNMNRYFGRVYQGFYLAGIAAGLKTKSNKIGFVSAFGKKGSESAYCLNAFAMGAESVNKKAQVYTYVINCWDDEKKERVAAEELIKLGIDVLGQDTDSSTPQIVAQDNEIFSVGYNSDASKDAPKSALLSVVWNWNYYYTETVQNIIEKKWDGSNYFGGLKESTINITELADFNHPDAQKEIDKVSNKIKDGEWDVFTGKIVTNTGKVIGQEGKSLADDDIQFKTNWLYRNIKEVK